MARPVGWYRLKSGVLFHGTLPEGVEGVDAPEVSAWPRAESGEEPVDSGEGGTAGPVDDTGVDLAADPLELGTGEGTALTVDGAAGVGVDDPDDTGRA